MLHKLIRSCWLLWPKELCVFNIIKKIDLEHHHTHDHDHDNEHDHHHNHTQSCTIIKEEFCGNFTDGEEMVWQAPSNHYLQGTFQVFNSSSSVADVTVSIDATPSIILPAVRPGFTISRAAINPTSFTINAPPGSNGTYCITLYKVLPFHHHEPVE
ncbi:S-Ena type endospore appendage [Robertmurraya kyonggiensis]|uniref:Endospore appendages core domain-containing protein n=1 Tax=Robertmurraya kyonggiensis TaxID=1037680 RepID=A0A4U1CYS1_9BACI|nr:S-Ena type endospore appendage [Robertmurraya kyonggiensis]TKC14319.1 hypothetical protein FA727_22470 [Robertmurraya kyonggiensis]